MKNELIKAGGAILLLTALVVGGLLALVGVSNQQPVAAAPTFTGDVEVDFDPAVDPDVVVIPDPGGVGDVGIPSATAIAGWDMRDLRYVYDAAADELFFGLNFDGVGGDPDGDGDPASGPITLPGGGTDQPNWAGDETFAVVLDTNNDGFADVIAGIDFLDDISMFTIENAAVGAAFSPAIPGNYLGPIPGVLGQLPTNTSATSPDIEFSIVNFSTLVPDPSQLTLGVLAFAGALTDGGVGEEFVSGIGVFETIDLTPPEPEPEPEPGLEIEKSTNGIDADTPAEGPLLATGSTATFEYIVTNTGNVDLVDIEVTDDILGVVCTIQTLSVGADISCTADAPVGAGDYVNIGTATGFQDDGMGEATGDPVTDDDPSHHTGGFGAIDLEKTIFGADVDEPGVNLGDVPNVPVGVIISFDFQVTNTGSLDLANIVLVDDVLGPITCPRDDLGVGESMTCSGDHVVSEGLTRNEGSVEAQPVGANGLPFGDLVSDNDPAHHRGFPNTIDIEKATNGDDADDTAGPNVPLGAPVLFTYVVTNTSPIDIVDAVVTDNVEGQICVIDFLGAGQSATCEATIEASLGAYENDSSVEGQPINSEGDPAGPPVTDDDPSHHFGVCDETIDGPVLYQGGQTVWDTGYVAGDNSTIQLITTENGGSPNQPNEQVYLLVGDDQYGPSPVGLGTITFDITSGGPVTVVHISEVDSGISGPNSVIPSFCGTDLSVAPPLCTDLVEGPALWAGAETVWNTGLTAETGSTLRLVTSENGASPAQPNEQVYVEIAGELYGPSPAGLGEIEIEVGQGGPVTILHYSVVTGDVSSPNSVVPALCGTDLTVTPPPVCTNLLEGPALWAGAETVWTTGLTAQAGSTLRIVTTENGASPAQPNEQVYIQVGDDQYGPTPSGLGEFEFVVDNTGPVTILHYSVVTGDVSSPNSVVPALCGTDLAPTPILCTDLLEGPALYVGGETVWNTGLTATAGEPIRVVTTENGASPAQPNEQVYVKIGDDTYGPSPAGLGAFEFTPTTGGEVTVLHYSVVTGDTSSPNSVVPALCGPGLNVTPPACVDLVEGPVLYHGGETVWHTNFYAKDNSKIRVAVSENGGSPDQPNERVFLQVNGETIGMTPSADGEATFDVVTGGPVSIVHYSVVTGDTSSSNSVVPAICGSDSVQIEGGLSCELPDGTPVTVDLDGNIVPANFDGGTHGSEGIHAIGSPDALANFDGNAEAIGGLASGEGPAGLSLAAIMLLTLGGFAALTTGAALGARRH